MSLEFTLNTLDNLDENTKSLYKKEEDGTYVLNVAGAVSEKDFNNLKEQLDTARKSAVGEDGRSYKEMFEGSQTANKAIRTERDNFKNELDKFKEFGTIENLRTLRDELDGFKAKGVKLDEVTQANIDLKQSERNLQTKLDNITAELDSLKQEKATLENYKAEAERKADIYDAEQKITAIVESLKEANQKALKSQLLDRYRMGDLIRSPKGEIVGKEDAMSLLDYAKDKMESYGLYAKSAGGEKHNTDPAKLDNKKTETGISGLAALFH